MNRLLMLLGLLSLVIMMVPLIMAMVRLAVEAWD
jgi:hypothetical protein